MNPQRGMQVWGGIFIVWFFGILIIQKIDNAIINILWLIIFIALFVNLFVQARKVDKAVAKLPEKTKKDFSKNINDAFKLTIGFFILAIIFSIIFVVINKFFFNDSLNKLIEYIALTTFLLISYYIYKLSKKKRENLI